MAGKQPGEVMTGLMTGAIAAPVWLRVGRARHLVRPEDVDAVARGLLLALELEELRPAE